VVAPLRSISLDVHITHSTDDETANCHYAALVAVTRCTQVQTR